jgi:hypothetical protein
MVKVGGEGMGGEGVERGEMRGVMRDCEARNDGI